MTNSDIIAIAALAVSALSLIISAVMAWNDRPRLRVESTYSRGFEDSEESMVVHLVNVGRRPVVLVLYGGSEAPTSWRERLWPRKRRWSANYFNPNPLVLEEQRHHELRITKHDTIGFIPNGRDIWFNTMWVSDSRKRRYEIPGAREHIKKLWEKPKAS
ncbi:UNVERIFIED_ORG: hypothetical protein LHJ69_14360 [Shinella sp. XGS7]|nr:hypothetical protein [Shinella sp. XGS7]